MIVYGLTVARNDKIKFTTVLDEAPKFPPTRGARPKPVHLAPLRRPGLATLGPSWARILLGRVVQEGDR